MNRRRTVLCALAGTVVMALPPTAVAAQPTANTAASPHTQQIAGIDVVPDDLDTLDPAKRPTAAAVQALQGAFELARQHPDDLGYPWLDTESGKVVLNSVSAKGGTLAAGFQKKQTAVEGSRATERSYRELEQIKHEAIGLTDKDVPDGKAIFETAPDGEHNRVLITVKRLSTSLASALGHRYGTDAIALVHAPDRAQGSTQDRQSDTSPFYGGALINAPAGSCTSGFSWIYGGEYMMVSAGHCASEGGSVSTPAQNMGTVTETVRENWNEGDGQGTQLFPGQTRFRGDLSLIAMDPDRRSTGRVYRAGSNATTGQSAPVSGIWQRRAAVYDQYCTSGQRTGELCGWLVVRVEFDHRYGDGTVARNAVRGQKRGQCTLPGDSGGPLYTVNANGSVTGKGIHSGGGGGGDDSWGGLFDPCFEIFTDIRDAWEGLPGIPLTQ
ncbi:S1 family peptidase [Streptomyces sp. NPDC050211]|uniref:S1 family peptidase n=1 Tax=Streptomyces sp. NPDC050211 TaxID=3154932 RepID=UPI0034224807